MLVKTMSVQEVARLKGVSEAGIRFAVNDPLNISLLGIKCGGRLLILASSVAGYTPRNYPRKEELKPFTNAHQRRILKVIEGLAAEMVAQHPDAARILRACYPGGNIAQDGKPGYSLGFFSDDVLLDDLHVREHEGSAEIFVIFDSDDDETIKQKAHMWAIKLVEDRWIEHRLQQ